MQPSDSNYQLPPFPAFPSTSRYVPVGSVQDALTRICRSIDTSEAISLVIGPPGTGKSLLCALIAQRYRDTHDVVVLGETRMEDRNAFLRHLLHHLGVNLRTICDGDLQLAVIDRVCGDEAPEGGLLLVIDEAQSLPPDVLEAIRMVTNIMHHGVPRVSAVVCGGVKLDDMLVEPSLEAFTQRVATRCYLHPLNGEETRRYVYETIRKCGAAPETTISDGAVATIHHACSGVPRLINQLMTQAIDCAEEADQAKINERIIDIAWSQLQQLPSPMIEEPRIVLDASPVEFGELDDSDAMADDKSPVEMRDKNDPHDGKLPRFDDIEVDGETELWLDDTRIMNHGAHARDVRFDQPSEKRQAVSEAIDTSSGETFEPSKPSVFGDWEDEEEVSIGKGVSREHRRSDEPPADLEQALHQEIIGLNSYLSEVLGSTAASEVPYYPHDLFEDDAVESSGPEATVEDFVTDTAEESYDRDADPQPPEFQPPESKPEQRLRQAATDDEVLPFDQIPWEEVPCYKELPTEEVDGGTTYRDDSIFSIDRNAEESETNEPTAARDDSDLLVIEDDVEIRRIDAAKRYDQLDQTVSVDFQAMLSRMRGVTKNS